MTLSSALYPSVLLILTLYTPYDAIRGCVICSITLCMDLPNLWGLLCAPFRDKVTKPFKRSNCPGIMLRDDCRDIQTWDVAFMYPFPVTDVQSVLMRAMFLLPATLLGHPGRALKCSFYSVIPIVAFRTLSPSKNAFYEGYFLHLVKFIATFLI